MPHICPRSILTVYDRIFVGYEWAGFLRSKWGAGDYLLGWCCSREVPRLVWELASGPPQQFGR